MGRNGLRTPRRAALAWLLLHSACSDKAGSSATGDTGEAGGEAGSGDTGEADGGSQGSTASASTTTGATSTTGDGTTGTSGSGSTTGTTGSSSTTGGETSGGDEGTPFVVMPDGGGSAKQCDPRTQDCPEGEKCAAWANDGGNSWNANKCVPETGEGVAGDSCMVQGSGVSGLDDCARGYMCWNVDAMGIGTCVAFCGPNDTCEDPDTFCSIQNDGSLPLCSVSCDPIIQDCPEAQGCYARDGAQGELICIPDASGSMGADGDPCEFDNVCDPGLVCIGGSAGCTSTWCCTPWCDVSAPNTCPGEGEMCLPHFSDPAPGLEDVGQCVVPE